MDLKFTWALGSSAVLAASLLTSCTAPSLERPSASASVRASHNCSAKKQVNLGQFAPEKDLLLAHFDSKPDADDLHAVAALGTMLRDPRFGCVNYLAIAGAYGKQGGAYIPAPELFTLAFGANWRSAHDDKTGALRDAAQAAAKTLKTGGDVWIMEAGQSDFTADLLRALSADRARIHVVQHSDWNEKETTPAALAYVKAHSDYHKIADGNAVGNGTPGFNTADGSAWPQVLADPRSGAVWREAKRVSDLHNPKSVYVNPSIAAGGFDFSDAAEAAWIFGFAQIADTREFFEIFG